VFVGEFCSGGGSLAAGVQEYGGWWGEIGGVVQEEGLNGPLFAPRIRENSHRRWFLTKGGKAETRPRKDRREKEKKCRRDHCSETRNTC